MSHPRRNRALVLASLVAVFATAACNNYSSPTNNGGGGGGGAQFNLGPFAVGQSARFTFANAGAFGYYCIPHRAMGMTGTVQVDASGADSVVVQIAASGLTYSPSTAHVKPGGYVRWVNASSSTVHTVTSE